LLQKEEDLIRVKHRFVEKLKDIETSFAEISVEVEEQAA
jgi:hypothetical protein